jgi:peptide/nickel transport system permease protein
MTSMKSPGDIFLFCVLATVTWVRFDILFAGVESLSGYVLHVITLQSLPRWDDRLAEYWFGTVAWLGIGAWLLRRIYHSFRTPDPPLKYPRAIVRAVLAGLVCVSITAPIIAPLDPSRQGNLVTARMLPPMSRGTAIESEMEMSSLPSDLGGRLFVRGRDYLVRRTVHVVGGDVSDSSVRGAKPIIFVLGTDDNARDVLSRVIFGARVTLGVGLLAALGSVLIGTVVGFVAAMSRGWMDALVMRMTDLVLAVPGLLLVIACMAFLGQSVYTLVLVLALTGWMGIARVVRGEVLALRDREFVLAARMLHVSRTRIVLRHLLPNIRPVIVTGAVLQFANAALGEAALGFLGLGVQPPTPSWGNMMGEATGYLARAWWVGFFPGLFLATVIVATHYVSERGKSARSPSVQYGGE